LSSNGIITLGDAFIDYISLSKNNVEFDRKLGGATVNVAVHLSRMNVPSYYITKLGMKEDSVFVKEQLQKERVRLDYSVTSKGKLLSKVYIHIEGNGERQFHSYVNETPDDVVNASDIEEKAFLGKKIFYFGSGTLFHLQAREATLKAINFAKKHGLLIVFDANIRLKRWESEEECRNTILYFIPLVDIFKLSKEELSFLFQQGSFKEDIGKIKTYPTQFQLVTMGENGAIGLGHHFEVHVPTSKIQVKDTNGSGDAFMAAIIYNLYKEGIPNDPNHWKEFIVAGNTIGTLVATYYGSLPLLNYKDV